MQINEWAKKLEKIEMKISNNRKISNDMSMENNNYQAQIEDEIQALETEKQKIKIELIELIKGLSDERYVTILYEKHINKKSYAAIATEMSYSVDHIKRLHRLAANEFACKNNVMECDG